MTKADMKNEVVRTLGFENELTILFFRLCEDDSVTEDSLFSAMIAVLAVEK